MSLERDTQLLYCTIPMSLERDDIFNKTDLIYTVIN